MGTTDPAATHPAATHPAATYPAATFRATREGLLGLDPLPATAEIARRLCRAAERTVHLTAITATRLRRIDGWLGTVGFVTHATSTDRRLPMLGSVCDRELASPLLAEILGSLVGDLPARPAGASFELPAVVGLAPGSMPVGADWIVVVTATSARSAPAHLIIASADGLLAGEVVAPDRRVMVEPIGPAALDARLVALAGARRRSLRDLLGGD